MSRFILPLALILLLSSCSPKRFIISSKYEEEISIDIFNTLGRVSPGVNYEYKTSSSPPINITGTSENFKGQITYMKNPDNKFSLQVRDSENITEIKREIVLNNSGNEVEVYHLFIDGNAPIAKASSPSGEFGYLNLTSNERDVEVYLDNEKIGTIADVAFNKKVPAGRHILMVRKDFFIPISIKVDIRGKEIYPYNFELKSAQGWIEEKPDQASTMQARGNLTIATERSDYKVRIEGVEKAAPFQIKDMPAGIYKVMIICPDLNKDLEITVNENQTTFIDLDELIER